MELHRKYRNFNVKAFSLNDCRIEPGSVVRPELRRGSQIYPSTFADLTKNIGIEMPDFWKFIRPISQFEGSIDQIYWTSLGVSSWSDASKTHLQHSRPAKGPNFGLISCTSKAFKGAILRILDPSLHDIPSQASFSWAPPCSTRLSKSGPDWNWDEDHTWSTLQSYNENRLMGSLTVTCAPLCAADAKWCKMQWKESEIC